MRKSSRLLLAAAVAGATMFTSLSADAFWGPFSFMRWGGWGDGWGWGGPWGGWGGPWSGYGWGYPGYGWGYPGYGWGGAYPGYGYGGWGSPYGYGWGVPYAYPAVVAAPAAPATSSAK
jgi:hypothetical protein